MPFFERFKKKKVGAGEMPAPPLSIAIIMDGNGRWAKKQGLPRTAGHVAGADNFRKVARLCADRGVKFLTVFAFSTENWKRPPEEVRAILDLLISYLEESLETVERERVHLTFFGNLDVFDENVRSMIDEAERMSRKFSDRLNLNVCVNYGGRDEIVRAARRLAQRAAAGEIEVCEIDEEMFAGMLYSSDMPDPDIIIRSGAEKRVSNFLLWQSAYSELFFVDTLWPDFGAKELDAALADYAGRNRRRGGV